MSESDRRPAPRRALPAVLFAAPLFAALLFPPPPAAAQPAEDDEETPPVDIHIRLRSQHVDEVSDLGDPKTRRLSFWTDTRIGERLQVRATYDAGEGRVHDLWAQFAVGGGLSVRVGRSAPLWLGEFTDAPVSFQMANAAVGAALTPIRDDGVFLFWNRGDHFARFHVIQGSAWEPDDNDRNDVLGSYGRFFGPWRVEAGHYEGREGPDLSPRRQTGVHLDGTFSRGRFLRGALYRREQVGRNHLGGFARVRRRSERGLWTAAEFGFETNIGPPDDPGNQMYAIVGLRYELPWTLTHLTADFRRRFGVVTDNEVILVFSWVLDFKKPWRN